VLEQFHARQRLRHEHRRLDLRRQVQRLAARQRRQQALRAEHAEHVVQPAAAHRIARVPVLGDDGQHLLERGPRVQPDDLGARDHHRADLPVVEAEHVAHHLVLLRLDHAGIHALLQLAAISSSVTAREGPPRCPAAAAPRWCEAEQGDQRPCAVDSQFIGRATSRATVSGYICPSRLGTSSPKMMVRMVMITTTRPVATRLAAALAGLEGLHQPMRQRRRERRLADDAVEHADGRDADLHRRQELGRVVVQVHRGLRAGLTGFRPSPAGAPCGRR
jgi:hypothetical protein